MKVIKIALFVTLLLVFLVACKADKHITYRADTRSGLIKTIDKPGFKKPVEFIPDWTSVSWGPFTLLDPPEITNPVLTAKDVTDREAAYVADPFLFHENGVWYMFMEVFDQHTSGDIGLASSTDGYHWNYERIVLDEAFHLSYPYVFKVGATYYMIPETFQLNEVRIYKAIDFPDEWTYLATIITGRPFVDPSIFYYDGRYWLFVGEPENKTLYLYSSNSLTENWAEHPLSPVIQDNTNQARPGGRSFIFNGDQIIRIAQNWGGGLKVRAFKVDVLDMNHYVEHELPESPLLESGLRSPGLVCGGNSSF